MKTSTHFLQWLTVVLLLSVNAMDTMAQGPSTPGDYSVCLTGISEPYRVTDVASSTFAWSVLSGVSGTDWVLTSTSPNNNNIEVLWKTPGTYKLQVIETNSNLCPGTPVTIQVTVNALPIAPTKVNVTECFDGNVHTGSATAGAGESIVWYDAATGGNIITAPSGTAPGTYTAYAGSKNNTTNCESSARTLVTVTIHPQVNTSPIYHN